MGRMLLDRRFQWNNATHQGMPSTCRVQVFESGLGPIIIVTDAKENAGPPVARVINCLACVLRQWDEVAALLRDDDFDSAMWYLGARTPEGPMFFRIREGRDDGMGYHLDEQDSIPGPLMDLVVGGAVSTCVVRGL